MLMYYTTVRIKPKAYKVNLCASFDPRREIYQVLFIILLFQLVRTVAF